MKKNELTMIIEGNKAIFSNGAIGTIEGEKLITITKDNKEIKASRLRKKYEDLFNSQKVEGEQEVQEEIDIDSILGGIFNEKEEVEVDSYTNEPIESIDEEDNIQEEAIKEIEEVIESKEEIEISGLPCVVVDIIKSIATNKKYAPKPIVVKKITKKEMEKKLEEQKPKNVVVKEKKKFDLISFTKEYMDILEEIRDENIGEKEANIRFSSLLRANGINELDFKKLKLPTIKSIIVDTLRNSMLEEIGKWDNVTIRPSANGQYFNIRVSNKTIAELSRGVDKAVARVLWEVDPSLEVGKYKMLHNVTLVERRKLKWETSLAYTMQGEESYFHVLEAIRQSRDVMIEKINKTKLEREAKKKEKQREKDMEKLEKLKAQQKELEKKINGEIA